MGHFTLNEECFSTKASLESAPQASTDKEWLFDPTTHQLADPLPEEFFAKSFLPFNLPSMFYSAHLFVLKLREVAKIKPINIQCKTIHFYLAYFTINLC